MSPIPRPMETPLQPLTLKQAVSDLAIIILVSALIIGLVVILHTVLPPIA